MTDYTEAIASLTTDGFESVDGYEVNDSYVDGVEASVSDHKAMVIDPTQVVLCCESMSQYVVFNLCRYYDGIDLAAKTLRVHFVNANGEHGFSTPINVCKSIDRLRLGWVVPHDATHAAGDMQVTIEVVDSDTDYVWSTRVATLRVEESLLNMEPSTPIIMLDDLYKYIDDRSFKNVTNEEFAAKAASAGIVCGSFYGYPLGCDCEVGSYMPEPPFPQLEEAGIKVGDIIFDTASGCVFKWVAAMGMIQAEGLECIANHGSSGGGGFKKIGFTSDCDYVATSSNGYTTFNQAVSEANDGDVIVVLPGEYSGSSAVTFTKNITFIGIGKPMIKFPVNIGTSSQAYTVRFDNFDFRNTMKCIEVDTYTSSRLYICNSKFLSSTTKLVGTFKNCNFYDANVSCSLSYAGDSSSCEIVYYNCEITYSTIYGDCAVFRECTIRESTIPNGYESWYIDCSLYNFTNKMSSAYNTYLDRCVLYGNNLNCEDYFPTCTNCYLVSGEAL